MSRSRSLGWVSVIVVGTLGFAGPVAASGLPTLLRADVTSDFVVRPATISFGASGDYFVTGKGRSVKPGHYGRIRWSKWTSARASGSGTLWINSCSPNCAAGSYVPHPVTLAASRVRAGRFTHLLLRYRLNGRSIRDCRVLGRLTGTRTPAYQWLYRC
jgi:hypothetical protein